jgi:hypothetical protein
VASVRAAGIRLGVSIHLLAVNRVDCGQTLPDRDWAGVMIWPAFLLAVVIGNILYTGAAILQGGEDPRFEGDKIINRS